MTHDLPMHDPCPLGSIPHLPHCPSGSEACKVREVHAATHKRRASGQGAATQPGPAPKGEMGDCGRQEQDEDTEPLSSHSLVAEARRGADRRRAPWDGRTGSARMGGLGPVTRWSRPPPTSARGCRPRRSRIGPNPAKKWWACSSGRATNSREAAARKVEKLSLWMLRFWGSIRGQ